MTQRTVRKMEESVRCTDTQRDELDPFIGLMLSDRGLPTLRPV